MGTQSIAKNEAKAKRHQTKRKDEGISLIDGILRGDASNQDVSEFKKIFFPNGPMIYAFVTPKVKDAIKVGFTDQSPERRIEQWRKIYDDKDNKLTCLGYWSSEEFNEVAKQKQFFWDHAVHNKLEKKGYHQFKDADDFYKYIGDNLHTIHHSREFFNKYIDGIEDGDARKLAELNDKILVELIEQMKKNIKEGNPDFKVYSTVEAVKTAWGTPATYYNTTLQEDVIQNGVKAIKAGKTKLLMSAVMRFGKTHACYEIVKHTGKKRILVTSAKADVKQAWKEDINHKDFYNDFVFVTFEGNGFNLAYKRDGDDYVSEKIGTIDELNNLSKNKTIIIFDTLQALGGSIKKLKAKHSELLNHKFDMMIIDETHYGSHASLFGQVTGLGAGEDSDDDYEESNKAQDNADYNEAKADANCIKDLSKNCDIILQVSGTPYYILASNEFVQKSDAEIISKVSYTDMIKARDEWEEMNPNEDPSKSPYFGIPTLVKIGLNLNKESLKAIHSKNATTSISALFQASGKKFKHEKAIVDLMKGMFGDGEGNTIAFLKNKAIEGSKTCRHTMMVLPQCGHCHMMKELLIKEGIIDPNDRKIIVAVNSRLGKSDAESSVDLNRQLAELDKQNKKSLVITVRRYLTGVSMPMLDSMIYLKNARSPQEYDQAIFRLCTRNVQEFDDEGTIRKINKKRNVYLIDFNMENMFNMLSDSAYMKAKADGDVSTEHVKKLMDDDLKATPVFSENTNGEVLWKMKIMSSTDLMRHYVSYNENKSLSDIVNDAVVDLRPMLSDVNFRNTFRNINVIMDKGKNTMSHPDAGNDTQDIDTGKISGTALKTYSSDSTSRGVVPNKEESKEIKAAEQKLKTFVKTLLCFNMVVDNPQTDIDNIIKQIEADKELENIVEDFGLSFEDIKKVNKQLSLTNKSALNRVLVQISMSISDSSNKIGKIQSLMTDIGRISKSEIPTPETLVDKMIGKLDDSEYKKAKTILLVRELTGEFIYGLYKKFGIEAVKKCRVVPGSLFARQLIIKSLKTLKLDDYINDIIIPIEDRNNNNLLYDDFLDINNKDILDYNMGKKFDICLMNPPYAQTGDAIHLRFVDKCLDICDKQVAVMPFTFVTVNNTQNNKYKEIFDKYLIEIEEIKSNVFSGTKMPNVGIYNLTNTKDKSQDIKIIRIDSDPIKIKKLNRYTKYTEIENNIISILSSYKSVSVKQIPYMMPIKHLHNKNIYDDKTILNKKIENAKLQTKGFDKNKIYLICNSINGGLNGKFFTPKTGQIFKNFDELNDFIIKTNDVSNGYNVLFLENIESAQNIKIALQNPILRCILYKTQDNQRMTANKCYKYIPNIDWSDDRVRTDEGLLEACGCPKDKAKEYADYCKDIIERVDNGERP